MSAQSDRPALPELPAGLDAETRVLMTRYAMKAVDSSIACNGSHHLMEALREIEWSTDSEWQRDRARAAIAKVAGEAA